MAKRGSGEDAGKTFSEQAFYERALERTQGQIHRHGWPDFLFDDPSGGVYAVEVKHGPDDRLRENQRHTFATLEKAGIRIWVYNADLGHRLIPWAQYEARLDQARGTPRWEPSPEAIERSRQERAEHPLRRLLGRELTKRDFRGVRKRNETEAYWRAIRRDRAKAKRQNRG